MFLLNKTHKNCSIILFELKFFSYSASHQVRENAITGKIDSTISLHLKLTNRRKRI
jgi:hypothetical protein